MARLSRGVILGLMVSLLLGGSALAGPTWNDGDPDQPLITNPGDHHFGVAGSQVSTGVQTANRTEKRAQEAGDHWKLVLKVYLRMISVFTR